MTQVRLFTNQQPVADNLMEAKFEHGEYEHEVVSVRVARTANDERKWASGVPVTAIYGTPPHRQAVFIGYVNDTEPVFDAGRIGDGMQNTTWVHCVGASWVFKDGGFYGATNRTTSAVVSALASAQRFSLDNIEANSRVWTSLTQNGRSEWEFLADLAKKSGFTLYARGLSLFFHRRVTGLAQTRTPVITLRPRGQGGTIIDWQSNQGQAAPSGGDLSSRIINGVDPRSGKVFSLQNVNDQNKPMLGRDRPTPVFSTGVLDPVHSPSEALHNLGAVEGENELVYHADVTCDGDALLRIGTAVNIVGMSAVDTGLWYVKRASHHFMGEPRRAFSTALELGRDASGGRALPPAPTIEFQPDRGGRLMNGKWVLS